VKLLENAGLFVFPIISWKQFLPLRHEIDTAEPVVLSGCSSKPAVQRTGQTGKDKSTVTRGVRTVKSHTFRDALSKNKLITLTAFFPEKQ